MVSCWRIVLTHQPVQAALYPTRCSQTTRPGDAAVEMVPKCLERKGPAEAGPYLSGSCKPSGFLSFAEAGLLHLSSLGVRAATCEVGATPPKAPSGETTAASG